MNKTKKIKMFFTKSFNKDNTIPFAWYNTQKYKLDNEDIEELAAYINKSGFIRKMIIVNGIEISRPQRTFGSMPDWFRPNEHNNFDNIDYNNSFIFVIYNSDWGKDISNIEINEAIKSFPKNKKILLLKELR